VLLTKNIYAPDGTGIVWKMGGWEIFGIVVGCLAILGLIFLGIYYFMRYRRRKQ